MPPRNPSWSRPSTTKPKQNKNSNAGHSYLCCACSPGTHWFFCRLKTSGCPHHHSIDLGIPYAAPFSRPGDPTEVKGLEQNVDWSNIEPTCTWDCPPDCKVDHRKEREKVEEEADWGGLLSCSWDCEEGCTIHRGHPEAEAEAEERAAKEAGAVEEREKATQRSGAATPKPAELAPSIETPSATASASRSPTPAPSETPPPTEATPEPRTPASSEATLPSSAHSQASESSESLGVETPPLTVTPPLTATPQTGSPASVRQSVQIPTEPRSMRVNWTNVNMRPPRPLPPPPPQRFVPHPHPPPPAPAYPNAGPPLVPNHFGVAPPPPHAVPQYHAPYSTVARSNYPGPGPGPGPNMGMGVGAPFFQYGGFSGPHVQSFVGPRQGPGSRWAGNDPRRGPLPGHAMPWQPVWTGM